MCVKNENTTMIKYVTREIRQIYRSHKWYTIYMYHIIVFDKHYLCNIIEGLNTWRS